MYGVEWGWWVEVCGCYVMVGVVSGWYVGCRVEEWRVVFEYEA